MQATKRSDSTADSGKNAGQSRLNPSVLARITQMAFRHRLRMAVAIVATIAAAVFQLFVPQFLGRAVDQAQGLLTGTATSVVDQNLAEAALLTTALLLLFASVLRGLATMMQNYQGEAVGQIIGYELRLAYYQKLQSLSFSWRDRVHSGDLMTRGMLDVEGVRLWVSTGVLRMILLSILIGGGAIILIDIDPALAAIALAMVPFIGVRASIARLRLRDAWLKLQEEMSLLTRAMEENLAGIRVVRAFAAEALSLIHISEPTRPY